MTGVQTCALPIYFADWYIEISKVEGRENLAVLLLVLEKLLILLHPFVPFVTEQIWSYINPNQPLIRAEWPKVTKEYQDPLAEQQFEKIRSIITAIRTKKAELKIDPVKKIPATIVASTDYELFKIKEPIISFLARVTPITTVEKKPAVSGPHVSIVQEGNEVILNLENIIDVEAEKTKIMTALGKIEAQIEQITYKLEKTPFSQKAQPQIVEEEKQKVIALRTEKTLLEKKLALFSAK